MLKIKLKSLAQKSITNDEDDEIFGKEHIKKNIFEEHEVIKESIEDTLKKSNS